MSWPVPPTHTDEGRGEGRAVLLGGREETVVSESELPETLDQELSLLTERVSSHISEPSICVVCVFNRISALLSDAGATLSL